MCPSDTGSKAWYLKSDTLVQGLSFLIWQTWDIWKAP